MPQDQMATDNAADWATHIAASIDWNPTCLPGGEQQAIVRQILRVATWPAEDGAAAQLAELRGRLHGLADRVERCAEPIAPAAVAAMIRKAARHAC